MTGFAVATFLFVASGFLLGWSVRGLTVEHRLRRRHMATLEELKADSEKTAQALDKALESLHELAKTLRATGHD